MDKEKYVPVRIEMTAEQIRRVKVKVVEGGYKCVSAYLRWLVEEAEAAPSVKNEVDELRDELDRVRAELMLAKDCRPAKKRESSVVRLLEEEVARLKAEAGLMAGDISTLRASNRTLLEELGRASEPDVKVAGGLVAGDSEF
jgi:hypothetical protein